MDISNLRLQMTSGDSNFGLDLVRESRDLPPVNETNGGSSPLRFVRNFVGELFFLKQPELQEVPPPGPGVSLDVQRYEPKGLVGMTMRVLRRRFFNLWSRSPSSWTDAVSEKNSALPGTFVSRKRKRVPATIESPTEGKSRISMMKNAAQSALFTMSTPMQTIRDKFRFMGVDNAYSSGDIGSSRDLYLIQVSQSEQLGIFGRRMRSSDEMNGRDYDQDPSVIKKRKDIGVNWIPWNRGSGDNKAVDAEVKGGWSISGYMRGEKNSLNEVNSNNNSNYPLIPSEPIIEVNSGWSFLPFEAVRKLRGIFPSSAEGDVDFISAPIATDGPNTVEVVSSTTGSSGDGLPVSYLNGVESNRKSLELRYAPAEYSLEAKNVPLWRWMIPNDFIAGKASDLGDSIKETLFSFIPNSNGLDTGREMIPQPVNTQDEASAFDYVYDGFTKTTALMTQSFFEGTSSVSDSFVAFTASPPWDSYYRVGTPQFTNISITDTVGGIGTDLYKGILGIGISLGVRKENVVSIVMEQDVSDQSMGIDNTDVLEPSLLKNVPSTIEDSATSLSVMSLPRQSRRGAGSRGKITDIVLSSVSGTAKNIFPMTSLVYGSVAKQLGRSMSLKGRKSRDSETQNTGTASSTAAVDGEYRENLKGSQWTQNDRLRSALSVTMRVIPILRIVPSFNSLSTRDKILPATANTATSTGGLKQLESGDKEDAPFAHVHVGDSERFYDLWKDDKKVSDIDPAKASNKLRETSFPFDEEALTLVSSAIDESFRANTGRGYKDSVKVDAVDGASEGERMKEEEALQSYDPSVVPSSGRFKVPFSMMTGEEVSSTTIDFINQLRSPFFQNTNTEAVKTTATATAAPVQAILGVDQFARPEVILKSPSSSSSAVSAAAAASSVSSSMPTAVSRSALPLSNPPPAPAPPANASFPFNFPFDSFRSASLRGFGGLTLPPATVRDISEVTLTDTEDDKLKGESYRRSSAGLPRAGVSTDDELSKLGGRRGQEMKNRLSFMNSEKVPLPTKADLSLILNRRVAIAVTAALACRTIADAKEYQREIGLKPLISAITESQFNEVQVGSLSLSGIKGVCRLIRIDNSVAVKVVAVPEIVSALCDAMEAPFKGFRTFRSQADKDRELMVQREAVALVQRIVRSSDAAVEILRLSVRLRKVLCQVAAQGEVFTSPLTVAEQQESNNVPPLNSLAVTGGRAGSEKKQVEKKKQERKERKSYANTTVVEYRNQTSHQMARVASWGLGGVQWKAKQPGQKGLRILSFDGGGTRGVLSIAMLKELMTRVSPNGDKQPYELFDIICGTSTGGIIAVLLGAQRRSVAETEALYDEFIDKVFGKKSNIKLVSETAAYDELELEKLLYSMCGDELLLDSNRYDCSRVFCLSTKVNNNPPQAKVWRNYNYPPGQRSRYPGAFRINTVTAVRATSAAPTFFTPVQWEQGLYCDGALVANNPTAIALQEAKVLYPGVPVELVVSIGTGYYNKNEKLRSMGWDLLVSQLIASSTDTEDVHALLKDFLPEEKYFRFNPLLQDLLAIDEKNKAVLLDLKRIAKETYGGMENGEEAEHVEFLINALKGSGDRR